MALHAVVILHKICIKEDIIIIIIVCGSNKNHTYIRISATIFLCGAIFVSEKEFLAILFSAVRLHSIIQ